MNTSDCRALYLSPGYPFPEIPSEGTFYHRRAKQLALAGLCVTVYAFRAITPASYVKYPSKLRTFFGKPRYFQYDWDGLDIACERVHFRRSGTRRRAIASQRKQSLAVLDRRFGQELKARQYDVIVFAGGSLSLGLAAADLARRHGMPLVSFVTGSDINRTWDKPASHKYVSRKEQLLASQTILAVSRDLKQKVDRMTGNPPRSVTFYSGVDVDAVCPNPDVRNRMRREHGLGCDEQAVLFVGHLIQGKGVNELIEVCRRLKKRSVPVRCFLVGRGEKREVARLRKVLSDNSLDDVVRIVGAVGHDKVIAFMRMADLFVFPSWSEGLPNAVLEAAAVGLPIVATDVGGIPEIIASDVEGRLVPPGRVQPLFDAVLDALTHPRQSAQWGVRAREKVCGVFNYHRNKAEIRSLLKQHDPHMNTRFPARIDLL